MHVCAKYRANIQASIWLIPPHKLKVRSRSLNSAVSGSVAKPAIVADGKSGIEKGSQKTVKDDGFS